MRFDVKRVMIVITALSLIFLTACGGTKTGTNAAPGPSGNNIAGPGTMSAKIDGKSWTASAASTATYSNGLISVSGADRANPITVISFAVLASGPGTFKIGQLDQPSANALLAIGAASWQAYVQNGSGTININTLTSTGASGTFSFNLNATPNSPASGVKVVTDGVFEVKFSAPVVISTPTIPARGITPPQVSITPTLPATGNADMTAEVNGEAWNGLVNRSASYKNQFFSLVGFDPKGSAMTIGVGGVAAAGTYSLSFADGKGSSAIYANSSGQGWGSGFTGGTGSITITVLTPTRAAGTFFFDAVPATGGATGTIHVTKGQFDVTY